MLSRFTSRGKNPFLARFINFVLEWSVHCAAIHCAKNIKLNSEFLFLLTNLSVHTGRDMQGSIMHNSLHNATRIIVFYLF